MDEFGVMMPNTLFGWLGILMALGFDVVTYLSRHNSETHKEREALIMVLKEKLSLFETMRADVDKLAAENAVLKQLVLGQDDGSKRMKEKAMKAIEQIEFLYEQKINEMKAQNVEDYINRPLRERRKEENGS